MNSNQESADRRGFLKSSSAALLAGTALLTEIGISEEEGKEVRIAVVGTGARGSDLIRKLSTIPRARIVAICDNYPPHLRQADRLAGPDAKLFTDFDQMLKKSVADAVVVATPLYLHYPMCMAAIDAGRAVFCEKTMCYSIDQAHRLAAAVGKKNVVFQVGLQRRANAIYAQASAMVETGMLGQITAIKCQWHRHNNWRRPVPVNRDDPAWSELEHRLNWRLYWAYSQGLMTELASHQMDVANRVLGGMPRRVMASGGIDYWRDGREVYDNVFCIYEYELPIAAASVARPESHVEQEAKESTSPPTRTVRVTYSSLQNNAYEGASELIMGTKGTLFITQKKGLFYQEPDLADPGWSRDGRVDRNAAIVTSGKTLKMVNDPWAHRGKPFEMDEIGDDTRNELVAFLDCVARGDNRTICDVHIGLENTLTVLLGNRAIEDGKPIEFPRIEPAERTTNAKP